MFCLRVQRGHELLCRKSVEAAFKTDADILFDAPRMVVLRINSLHPNAPPSQACATVTRLYLLPEVLKVGAYLADITFSSRASDEATDAPHARGHGPLEAVTHFFSAQRSRAEEGWQAALGLWERCCQDGSGLPSGKRSFVVRCHKRKEKALYTESSLEIEQALNACMKQVVQGLASESESASASASRFELQFNGASIRISAILSTRIICSIDIPEIRVRQPAKKARCGSLGGLGARKGKVEVEPEMDVDIDVDVEGDEDAEVLKGVLNKLEGFSEEEVRAEAKRMKVDISELVKVIQGVDEETLVVDVRSPVEFKKGCIPVSINIPLFSDKQRSDVGTIFKVKGRDAAIELGMSIVLPKLGKMKASFQEEMRKAGKQKLLMVCFRGGFRSSSVAWYIRRETNVDMRILEGGYKGFKRFARGLWDDKQRAPKVVVVGGRTGTGKTKLLDELHKQGRQVIDLEGLAHHKGKQSMLIAIPKTWSFVIATLGSTFGRIPFELRGFVQPSSEMFLNLVAHEWLKLDVSQPVFVEDEGQHIGVASVPKNFYTNVLRDCDVVVQLVVDEALRIRILTEDYANEELLKRPNYTEAMIESVLKAKKKLGSARAAQAVDLMRQSKFEDFAKLMLTYYDELYDRHIASATGTGSGGGVRSCTIVPVHVKASTPGGFDAADIVQRVTAILHKEGVSTPPLSMSASDS